MSSILIFGIVDAALVIWALVDILKSEFADSSNKIIWLLVVIFIPVLGFVLYFFVGRKQKAQHKLS
jgi:hypothetical protein